MGTFNNFDSAKELVIYLRNRLIPDLRESGSDATADDFEDCCTHLDDLQSPNEHQPNKIRLARIFSANVEEIAQYLPKNYRVVTTDETTGSTIIAGTDDHGWTLEGYVLPRLGSGMLAGQEITDEFTQASW
jgi:hypothetical protein